MRCSVKEYVQDLRVVFYQPVIPRGELRMFGSDLLSPASPHQVSIVPLHPSSSGVEVPCTFPFPVVWPVLLELRFTLEITVGIAGLFLTSNTQE